MTSTSELPLDGIAKFIIVDEGVDAVYGRPLIAGWLHALIRKDRDHSVDLLLFSDPRFWRGFKAKTFTSEDVRLHDFYSIDTDKKIEDHSPSLPCILQIIRSKSRHTVVVDCLSTLILLTGFSNALRFLEKLGARASQLICLYRRDMVSDRVPAVETIGTTYVKVEKYSGIAPADHLIYVTKIIHRKSGGSIINRTQVVKQSIDRLYDIAAENVGNINKSKETATSPSTKIKSSFRIEMSAREMEQRDRTPLPYTVNAANAASKILYQPDAKDDIDEDDPDDDLCF